GGAQTVSIETFKAKTRKIGGIAERLRSLAGGGPVAPVPPQVDGEAKAATGAEGPGDATLSRKASSAMNKLRALKSGAASSGGAADADGSGEAPLTAPPAAMPKGPEGPGEAVDEGLAKKASSAMSRLKALKAGGGS